MAYVNFDSKEIHTKILCLGPTGSGKKETLRSILRQTNEDIKEGDIELGPSDSEFSFCFVPVSVGYVKDYHLKLHLYIPPMSAATYETVEDVMFSGIDGVIYTMDSRIKSMDSNMVSFKKIVKRISDAQVNSDELVQVFQYNHSDDKNSLSKEEMDKQLNSDRRISLQTSAKSDEGIIDLLDEVTKLVIKKVVN